MSKITDEEIDVIHDAELQFLDLIEGGAEDVDYFSTRISLLESLRKKVVRLTSASEETVSRERYNTLLAEKKGALSEIDELKAEVERLQSRPDPRGS